MLRKSVVKNILKSRIFDVFLQCCDGCKFCGQEEKESTEAVGSVDVYDLLLSFPYFHSVTVVTIGTATFNYFSLLTLLHLLLINYHYLMNEIFCLFVCLDSYVHLQHMITACRLICSYVYSLF
jgi:uncharacterized protein (DUF983 family)